MGEWKEYKLGHLVEVKGGKRLPKGALLVDYDTGHPYIRVTDLGKKWVKKDGLQFVTPEIQKGISRYTVNSGDVILSIVGSIGFTGRISDELTSANLTENCVKFIAKTKAIDNDYLYYFLSSKTGQEEIDKRVVGSTQPKLPLYNIKDIEILLPSLPEQKSIASILSSIDDKIDLLHRQNKTLEALAETLFRQWFVEAEEEEWETGKLGDVISIYDSKRIPVSSMEREKMKIGELYPYYGAATIMDYINEYIFDGEYILMGEDGTVQTEDGYPVLQMATGKFWVNNHAHVFQAVQPYSNFLIYIFLKQTNISNIVTGAVQPKINQENLKSIEFPLPPDKKVNGFVLLTNSYWEKIKKNNDQIRTLTRLRDTLLPKLMSGEVRVKDLEQVMEKNV